MEETEIWKDVVGFEDYFQISNFGNIWSKRTNKIMAQSLSKTGYKQFSTTIGGRNGTYYCFKVHRLVADAFIEKPKELLDMVDKWVYKKIPVNHKDGNKLNNNVDNLEWCSYSQNSKHAVDNGLFVPVIGCHTYNSKFSEDEIRYIREVYKPFDKEFGARPLAKRFGVHHTVISKLARKVRYKNIE